MGTSTYLINGAEHSEASLIALAQMMAKNKFCEPHERAYFDFLLEWFDNSDSIMVKTSGSTGTPKLIQLDKKAMIASARATLEYLDLAPESRALLCLSTEYIAGKMMVVRALVGHLDLYIEAPSLRPLESNDRSYAFAAMVPAQVESSLDTIERIDKLIIGGGAISEKLELELLQKQVKAYSTYGMTETITHIAMRAIAANNRSFETLPGIGISTNDEGCLVIDAPYLRKPVITTDLVELDDAKHFRWLGRIDFVINSGGIKIRPEEVESKLSKAFEDRILAIGLPNEKWGEELALLIESKTTYDVPEETFAVLSKYERPKRIVFVDRLIETANGKIDRRANRALQL